MSSADFPQMAQRMEEILRRVAEMDLMESYRERYPELIRE
jgi:hypothetical protein